MPHSATPDPRYLTGLRRFLVTASAMLATTMVAVDSTIANVALPHIQAGMSASQEQVVWVLTSYLIAGAISTPLSAWLAGRFGRKLVMVLAAAGFTLASLACGAAVSLPMLVASRMVQGACGAGLIPLSQAMLLDITPPERHGRAMAIYGTGSMFGPLIGPTLGGFLIDTLNWRWVFLINLPIGILAVTGMVLFMAEQREKTSTRFDMFGFVVISAFLASFQLMLDRGQQMDWLDSIEVRLEGAAMLLFGWLSAVHMATVPNAFIRPRLFLDRNFAVGCIISASIGIISFAAVPMVTVMIQQLMGYPAMLTGIVCSPRGFGTLASMLVVGRLIGKFDTRVFLIIGLALTALGLFLFSGMQLVVGQRRLMVAGLFQGLGSGLMMVPLSSMVFATLPRAFRNEGTALYALTRNMGASLGISFLQTQATWNTARVQSRLVEGLRADNPLLLMHMPGLDLAAPASVAMLLGEVRRQATMVAYTDTYWMLCLISLAMMPVVLAMRPPRRPDFREKLRKVN